MNTIKSVCKKFLMLDTNTFLEVIKHTPLIAIDFIVEDEKGNILLGKRINEPAKDFFFTPGGRIFKNEKIIDAIKRLSYKELGKILTLNDLTFIGVYEHFYENSFISNNVSTHYIMHAYRYKQNENLNLPNIEHSQYQFFSKKQICSDVSIHQHVKNYFLKDTHEQ